MENELSMSNKGLLWFQLEPLRDQLGILIPSIAAFEFALLKHEVFHEPFFSNLWKLEQFLYQFIQLVCNYCATAGG